MHSEAAMLGSVVGMIAAIVTIGGIIHTLVERPGRPFSFWKGIMIAIPVWVVIKLVVLSLSLT